jgi:hypothetical protein
MDKYDIRRQFKELYAPRTRDFEVVTVPPFQYLMVDGQGNRGIAPAGRPVDRARPPGFHHP